MGTANRYLPVEDSYDTLFVWDHFASFNTGDLWTALVTDTGTVQVNDAAGGILVLTPSDATVVDNDEAGAYTTEELFLFANNKSLYARGRIMPTATSISVQNIGIGFVNAAGTDPLGDNGAGFKGSGSCFGVQKVDGSSLWALKTAVNGTAVTTISANKSVVSATWYDIELFGFSNGDSTYAFSAKVDGAYLLDSAGRVIVHNASIASATEMNFGVFNKIGANTNNDTLSVDVVFAKQRSF